MSSRTALAALLMCVGATPVAAAPPGKAPEQVTLTLIPATTSLYVGDPLLVKCILENQGKAPVVLSKPFDAEWAGVRFEACPPKGSVFKRVRAVWEGRACGSHPKYEVGAGMSIVCYERFYGGDRAHLPFSSPGRWQLRTSVTIGDEVITSAPVALEVADPPERVKKALRDYDSLISDRVISWVPYEDDAKAMLEARDRLAGSNAAQVIDQAIVLRALHTAGSAKARQSGMAALGKHRADLSPVPREYFDLLTADVLFQRKEYAEVKKLLEALPERSHKRDSRLNSIPMYLAPERR